VTAKKHAEGWEPRRAGGNDSAGRGASHQVALKPGPCKGPLFASPPITLAKVELPRQHVVDLQSPIFSFVLKRRYDFQGEFFIVENSAGNVSPAMSIDELMNYCGILLGPLLDDHATDRMWLAVDEAFRFRPDKDFFRTVTTDAARRNSFHPVVNYLDSTTWDQWACLASVIERQHTLIAAIESHSPARPGELASAA
jgi:hypothetical protein